MGFKVLELLVIDDFEDQVEIVDKVRTNIFIFVATVRLIDIDDNLKIRGIFQLGL